MTAEQCEALGLEIPLDKETLLMTESALTYVLDNTELKFNIDNAEELKALPAPVRLFVLKYIEIMDTGGGVTSESIEGLSQSFSGDMEASLACIAKSLLGKWMGGDVKFLPISGRWRQ